MLGHSHATSGALAWAGTAAALPLTVAAFPLFDSDTTRFGIAELIMGTLLTAGAALLPDADHPSGTISHVLGPVSHQLCRLISWVSGGHRHGTHSLLFVVAAVAATWAGEHYLGRPFTLSLVFFLLALAVRSLHLCPPGKSVRTYGTVIVLATAGTFAVDHWIVDRPAWLPICVGLGCLAHLLGDCLTDRGCRLLWPFPLRTRVPLIDRTGNRVETWVISPLFVLGTMGALWYAIMHRP
ncbi:metal-dependent hydrolase [Nocardia rhizosphaerihabitans]|uniref:Metal-dependent hydrolase n=1 Tax=Nocardia rhizosphaerihabitans TaxID=1691570 RepID=A0ABQ2K7S8_9NOCA|nr:metal-dependent hydrolase [Nocardia rhizosphaerihabitans]GGN66626.1 metal-dependent hydrolase [Nocardia rhizosphaerihabitans]